MTAKHSKDEKPIYRAPACPLHFGVGYKLDYLECRAMPTLMLDGTLRDSMYTATTEHLRRWAKSEQERLSHEAL